MSSFNKNLLVVGFTLALFIVASHRATADCEDRTGIMCTSDEMCVPICLQRGGYTGGRCSTEHVVGDPSDMKGENILVDPNGDIKLADFGNQIQLGRCGQGGRGGAQAGAAMEERVGVAGGGLRRVVCGQLFTEEEEDKGS
ncbi:hypothetical protein BDA96_05G167000 [Sorghum bicolor]|uniref:Protein kinase domain-containing protein n=2 Tax=Sorghum bicolor TaxID=4558 RepID=A0A921QYF8_SORBI|nr:hypothetical protein BDA96_05G167000 [Sorghum bicolor]OQU83646.1 hypothetical protein SORBI_3005G152866 [Sorghum bicolor]